MSAAELAAWDGDELPVRDLIGLIGILIEHGGNGLGGEGEVVCGRGGGTCNVR